MRRPTAAVLAALAALAIVGPAWAAGAAGGHADPVAPIVLALAVILASAKLAGDLVTRIGQPAVLGELLAGVILGNVDLTGFGWFQTIEADPVIDILARLGVLILLFEVGLESTVKDMLKVGLPSLLVALLGIVTPFALGWAVGALLLPDRGIYVHAFLGATLTATSVGITARVLKDVNRSQTAEARIILGAAVIDDVLGLVILAVVSGIIASAAAGAAVSWSAIAMIVVKALVFLVGALALGVLLAPRLFKLGGRLRGGGVLLATTLVFCFVLSYLSNLVGLAPIVGAYAAGLILEELSFRDFPGGGIHQVEELVKPISTFLVPVFFVLMGMRVDLRAFARPEVLALAALLTVAAIAGKQACSLGAIGGKLDRLSVGFGMMPRGEVGLIFANIGAGLVLAGRRVVDDGVMSAVVIMVIVTTVATPPALKWSLGRADRRRASAPPETAPPPPAPAK